jgi:hypothetical protein
MGLRPPPGRRGYFRFFLRFCFGISGLTRPRVRRTPSMI